MGNYGSKMSETLNNYGSKMPETPNEGSSLGTNPNSQDEIYSRLSEYNVIGTIERIYDILPKVFIDGHSLVKVSLTDRFVDCTNYMSRTGLTFEGCVVYSKHGTNDGLADVRGIYYPLNAPIYYFNTGRKISRDIEEMKEIILNHVKGLMNHIKLNGTLLISYNNYGITVYDRFAKGKIIKFPLTLEQGHLFISWVPKVPTELPFEKVTELNLYNHTIKFSSEVVKFNISVSGGQAVLVYNHHSVNVIGKIKSPDHGEKEIELMHGSFYLFSHARPRTQRGAD